jgi:hypothetical protein
MIESGEVKCTRRDGEGGDEDESGGGGRSASGESVEVNKRLRRGDVFGEVALLRDEPRQATVTAVSDTSCWTVDRDTFKRVLGDLEELTYVNYSSICAVGWGWWLPNNLCYPHVWVVVFVCLFVVVLPTTHF